MAPSSPPAAIALRSYYADIVSRYRCRAAGEDEIDAAMRDEPSDDLVPPRGLLVAVADDTVLGCAGLRILSDHIGEVTRVHVGVEARRRGLGSRLLRELEEEARQRGLTTLRLDTRGDLVEARRLYARHGYREVARFNDDPYAEHWFAKPLGPHRWTEGAD